MCLVPCSFQGGLCPGRSLSREVSVQGVSEVADRHSKILDACPPQGPNSFNFMHFFGKIWQNHMLVPPGGLVSHLGEILDLPLLCPWGSVRETPPYDEERAACIPTVMLSCFTLKFNLSFPRMHQANIRSTLNQI